MKFIIITGPQAVGKMTVAQELTQITGLKLLHNHMTIELRETKLKIDCLIKLLKEILNGVKKTYLNRLKSIGLILNQMK